MGRYSVLSKGGIHFGRTELSAFFDVEEMASNERVTGEGRHFLGKGGNNRHFRMNIFSCGPIPKLNGLWFIR